jgi:hypothetical protein
MNADNRRRYDIDRLERFTPLRNGCPIGGEDDGYGRGRRKVDRNASAAVVGERVDHDAAAVTHVSHPLPRVAPLPVSYPV